MFCPRRILVPVDFGSSAMPAVSCAHEVSRLFGSRIHLLHVSAAPAAQGWAAGMPSADADEHAEEWRAEAMRELAAFAARATQPGAQQLGRLGPTLAVRVSADAPAAILAYARETGCDLIVMGTHRPSTLALLNGSTADWVRRHAACPVIMVPPPAEKHVTQPRMPQRLEATMAAAS